MTDGVPYPSDEKAASVGSLRRRLTDLKLEKIVSEGNRLALASDIWRFARPSPPCAVLLTLAAKHANGRALVTWLVETIRQHEPGLKFQVSYHRLTGSYALYLTARYITLLKGAELLHLRKSVKARYGGGMRDFTVAEASCFQGVENRDTFITGQERALIVRTFLDMIRAVKTGDVVLDADCPERLPLRIHLREGQPIIARLLQLSLIEQIMPLHNREQLQQLKTDWVKSVDTQPLALICEYFGSQIALYFAWLGHYTWALCAPAALGLFIYWFGLLRLDDGDEPLAAHYNIVAPIDSNRSHEHKPPAAAGLIDWQLISDITFVVFGLFNCLWSTCYLELWKRRQAELIYKWGGAITPSTTISLLLDPRPTYKAEYYEPSPITGRLEPQYPAWKSKLFRYGVSAPVTAILIGCMIFACFTALRIQDVAAHHFGGGSLLLRWVVYVPLVVYSAMIIVADMLYRSLAVYLNDHENYRTDEEYENCLILKIVLFQCINAYGSLFYIAFYLQDMKRLRETLATLLISRQVIQNCFEVVVPYLIERFKISRMTYKLTRSMSENTLREQVQAIRTKHLSQSESECTTGVGSPLQQTQQLGEGEEAFNLACTASPILSPARSTDLSSFDSTGSLLRQRRTGQGEPDSCDSSEAASSVDAKPSSSSRQPLRLPMPEFNLDSLSAPEICDSELECLLPNYGTPLDDHLEMFIQFGYVLLFSPAFPMAALCALVNNILEIRVDAFKLCNNVQRPFGRTAVSIGAWQHALEIMGFVGVIVNCTLIGQSGLVSRLWPALDWGSQLLIIILLEHVILALKWAIDKAIPDVPLWVTVERAKMEFRRRDKAVKHPVDWSVVDTPLAGAGTVPPGQDRDRQRTSGAHSKHRSSSSQPHKLPVHRPTQL